MANTRRVITWWVASPNRHEAKEGGSWKWMHGEPMYNDGLEEFLWKALEDNRQQFQQAYQATKPLWFGLWMDSPLSAPRCSMLAHLLAAIYVEEEEDTAARIGNLDAQITPAALEELRLHSSYSDEDVAKFKEDMENIKTSFSASFNDLRRLMAVAEACARDTTPLYVEVNPLGHTDWGWYTIFPHCPRCKATAPSKYARKQEVPCPVCGFHYHPDETRSMTKMEIDFSQLMSPARKSET